jgi:DNA-binding transcriptional MerR regulator/methylmalonyl-CoA mutase cobalamin-binding subunit
MNMDYSIRIASSRSGVSQHVIRVWEKRYSAVQPKRTDTNRRVYSDAEIERLVLLRLATAGGHSIGNVAKLSTPRLRVLVGEASAQQFKSDGKVPAQTFHDSCLQSVTALDTGQLEENLQRALIALGHQGLLRQVVAPLAQTVGKLWRRGVITAAHEHFLTASLKVFLGNTAGQFATSSAAPFIVIATPAGQLHELGAVMINAAAAQLGWRTIYLGASLPAAEIAGAAVQAKALAVGLSIVYPEDDPNLPNELISLRRFLPTEIKIVSGGRGAAAYKRVLSRIGALQPGDLDTFSQQLDALRKSAD